MPIDPSQGLPDWWTDAQALLFQRLYEYMVHHPHLFRAPGAPAPDVEHWQTTAWNCSWLAAHMMDGDGVLVVDEDGTPLAPDPGEMPLQ